MGKLVVRASGLAMVTDFEAMDAGVKRFVGRLPELKGSQIHWAPKAEASEVPDRAEYRQALADGDLVPADRATAELCGLSFKEETKKTKDNS